MRITGRTLLLRILPIIALGVSLAACDSGSSSCVSGPEGDTDKQMLNVYADNSVFVDGVDSSMNGWRRTDVTATKDLELYIVPASVVALCPVERYVFGEEKETGLTEDGEAVEDLAVDTVEEDDKSLRNSATTKSIIYNDVFNAKDKTGAWQDTGIYMTAGTSVAVDIDGQYSVWEGVDKGVQPAPCPEMDFDNHPELAYTAPYDRSCWINMGKGLVLTTGGSTAYEMYDYKARDEQGNILPGTRTIFTAPSTGILSMRHMNAQEMKLDGKTAVGGYKVDIYTNAQCIRSKGKSLYGYIGESPPASVQQMATDGKTMLDTAVPAGAFEIGSNYMPFGKNVSKAPADGTLWLKVIDTASDGDGNYDNNMGYYEVAAFADKPMKTNNFVRNVVNAVVDPIRDVLNKAAAMMFKGITNPGNVPFVRIIQALLVLYILFSCIGFMFGIIDVTQTELVVRIAKIAIVSALIGEDSWEFFYKHFFALFDSGLKYIIDSLMTLQNSESTYIHDSSFVFLTPTLDLLFAKESWKKIAALLFSGPLGWLYIILIIIGVVFFLVGLIKFVIIYLMALIGIALMISMAPVFICFVLFQQTKSLFEGWLKQLVNFMLQPILTLTALILINYWIFASLTVMLSYSSCYGCIWRFTIDLGANKVQMCVMRFWVMEGFITSGGGTGNDVNIEERMQASDTDAGRSNMSLSYSLPIVDKTSEDSLKTGKIRNFDIFFPILIFVIFAHAALMMPSFMPQVAASIVGASAPNLASAAGDALKSAGDYTNKLGGLLGKAAKATPGIKKTPLASDGLATAARRGVNFFSTGDPNTLFKSGDKGAKPKPPGGSSMIAGASNNPNSNNSDDLSIDGPLT